jgi:hypothetical protein
MQYKQNREAVDSQEAINEIKQTTVVFSCILKPMWRWVQILPP